MSGGQGFALPPEPPTHFCPAKEKKIMARPTKPAAVRLTELVQCRMTESEFLQLQEAARASGLSVSDFCRVRLINAKPRRKKATPERLALVAGLGSLGHIRSDINKLLKDRWAYKYVTPEQVQKAFTDIEAAADTILNALSNGD